MGMVGEGRLKAVKSCS